jgi:hypothetical protein
MAWSRVLTFTDPLSCQAAILSADVEILPTTTETFHTEITQVGTDRLWTQHFHVSSPQVCTIASKAGRQSIDFLTEANSSPWFFVQLYRWFPSILKVLKIVRPETLLRWHRAGFRCYWRWKSRRRAGRPQIGAARTDPADEHREPALGCAPHPRRTTQARV